MPRKGSEPKRGQFRVEISFPDLGPDDIPIADGSPDNPLLRLLNGLDKEFSLDDPNSYYVGGGVRYISRGPRKGALLEYNLPIRGRPKERLTKIIQKFLADTNSVSVSVTLRGIAEILTITTVDVVESSTIDLPY